VSLGKSLILNNNWLTKYDSVRLTEPTFWKDHLHPEDRDWAVRFCLEATAQKRSHDFEYRMIAADGRVVWLRDLVTVMVEDGRPSGLRGVMVDITRRKQAEEALRRSEANLAEAQRLTHTGSFVWDVRTRKGLIPIGRMVSDL
jgi:PAS domain S-box-containing protein